MSIKFSEFTSPGLVRSINQDSYIAESADEFGLFAVADGMGGHSNGEVASRRLVEELKKWWRVFIAERFDFERAYDELKAIINNVNLSIYEEYTAKGTTCGTTIALLFIYRDRYMIINSGDTRIYFKAGSRMTQESKDHVYGKESVISGAMTAKEAESSPNRDKLTAAVGCRQELKLAVASARVKNGTFFICSDGVYKYCSDKFISSAIGRKDTVSFIAEAVNKGGAGDNFTFICIRLSGFKAGRSAAPRISVPAAAGIAAAAAVAAAAVSAAVTLHISSAAEKNGIDQLRDRISEDPNDLAAYIDLAQLYQSSGEEEQVREIVEEYMKASENRSADAEALENELENMIDDLTDPVDIFTGTIGESE